MSKRTMLVVVFALVGAALLGVQVVHATPPITWQPDPFDMGIVPGGQMRVEVTAKLGSDLPPTRVEVTPSLALFIASITPSTLPALTKGSALNLTIAFKAASGTPPQTIEGTLRLRQTSSKISGTEAKPLPITLKVGAVSYPPDPGEAGKATLDGIDSNGDGLRDDVERYIALAYTDQPLLQNALRQDALNLQSALDTAGDRELSREKAKISDRADECIGYLTGFPYNLTGAIRAEMLNTDARSRAYLSYNANLGGIVSRIPIVFDPAACDFDVTLGR